MTFQQWIDAVDKVLVAKKSFYRVRDIDPLAMREAYDRGDSPIVFGKLAKHPMKGDHDAGFSATRRVSSWAIVGGGVFLGLLAIFVGRNMLRDREGARIAKEGPFPRNLPYDTGFGMYTPSEAALSLEATKDEVSRQMMLRSSAVFHEIRVNKILGPGYFAVSGEVEGRNKFGARLSTPFEARTKLRMEVGPESGIPQSVSARGMVLDFAGYGRQWICTEIKPAKIGEWRAYVAMERQIGDSTMDRTSGFAAPRRGYVPRGAGRYRNGVPFNAPGYSER